MTRRKKVVSKTTHSEGGDLRKALCFGTWGCAMDEDVGAHDVDAM